MSISYAIRTLLGQPEDPNWLMEKYVLTQQPKYLARLYDLTDNDIYHYLLCHIQEATAKDISQKTWLKVIERRHQFQSQSNVMAWLFTIARNCLLDEFRRQGRIEELVAIDQVTATVPAIDNTMKPSIFHDFDQALNALPFYQKEAFVLQQEGFSLNQIASITATEAETIKSRLRFAKQALRKTLRKHHD